MVTQPDFELQGQAVIDEDQFQETAEGIEYEMQGDSEAIDQAQNMNEERNDKLGIISRGVVGLSVVFAKVAAVIGAVLVILKLIANAFDITFEDVRSAIVNVLNSIWDTIKSLNPFGGSDTRSESQKRSASVGSALGGIALPGAGAGIGSAIASSLQGLQNSENLDFDLSLPRDVFQGDSTQKDKENEGLLNNIFDFGL